MHKSVSLLSLALSGLSLAAPSPKTTPNFRFHGVNEAAANFGLELPGQYGVDFTWPNPNSITHFLEKGFNTIRIGIQMERLTPEGLTAQFDQDYLKNLTNTVDLVTSNGAYAMIDPHNYGRYYNEIINSTADFGAWWNQVAAYFKDNDLVMFDVNNEFWGMDTQHVFDMNQAAIDAIRAAGATSQYITPEGNQWTSAWGWTNIPGQDGLTNSQVMGNLIDPSNKLVYQMHHYLNTDGSGNDESCVSATIGSERLKETTKWLRDNGKVAFIGEFAGGINELCQAAVKDMLNYMNNNSDVWVGFTWWAAGPWWGPTHYNSIEPADGIAYDTYVPILQSAASGDIFPPPPSTTGTPTSSSTTAPSATASLWEKCGGIGWDGPTQCPRSSCCIPQNQWYWQCVLDCSTATPAAAQATPTDA